MLVGVTMRKIGRWLVVLGCSYELVALVPPKPILPTLSTLSHKARRNPFGFIFVCAIYGWLTHHILFERVIPALESMEQAVTDLTNNS
jgi:hypothetical protein